MYLVTLCYCCCLKVPGPSYADPLHSKPIMIPAVDSVPKHDGRKKFDPAKYDSKECLTVITDRTKMIEEKCADKDGNVTRSGKVLKIDTKKLQEFTYEAYFGLRMAHGAMALLLQEVEHLKKELSESKRANESVTVPKAEIENVIKEYLPTVLKDAVKMTLESPKFVKSYADVLKKAQDGVVETAEKSLDKSIEKALTKNQQEIIESTKAKNDYEMYEKKNKARNIVIRTLPESDSQDPDTRIKHDMELVVSRCEINRKDIVKCYRIGKPKEDKTARPLIVTMSSPDLAEREHRYGLGRKIEEGLWINEDLTTSERVAAWKARTERRARVSRREASQQPRREL